MSCSVCKYAKQANEEGNTFWCQRFPPHVVPIPAHDRMTGQMTVGIHPVFPQVAGDAWCGEFTPAEGSGH